MQNKDLLLDKGCSPFGLVYNKAFVGHNTLSEGFMLLRNVHDVVTS